jgi:Spy/CpxP family protein refolding chaperone
VTPRLLVALVCIVNLVAGAAIGVVVDRTVFAEQHHGPGGGHRFDMAKTLEKRLELDADQAKKVRDILAARRPAFDEAMREARPRLEAARLESENAIRAVLRPDQAVKYDELRSDWQRHMHEMGGSRPGRAGGGHSTHSSTQPDAAAVGSEAQGTSSDQKGDGR